MLGAAWGLRRLGWAQGGLGPMLPGVGGDGTGHARSLVSRLAPGGRVAKGGMKGLREALLPTTLSVQTA